MKNLPVEIGYILKNHNVHLCGGAAARFILGRDTSVDYAPRGESGLSAKDFEVSIRHRTHEDRMVELEIIVSRKVQR